MNPSRDYTITWNVTEKQGIILLKVPNGIAQVYVDSPIEARALLLQLRLEQHVAFDNGILAMGFTPTGTGEDTDPTITLPTPNKDNLQLLDHVDANVEAILHAKGIYTFRAVADMDPTELKKILNF